MKDERGYYYHPSLQNKQTRMYVRDNNGVIEFRLWSAEEPQIWEKHQWLPYEVIEQAAAMFKSERDPERNPTALYDIEVAKNLLAN